MHFALSVCVELLRWKFALKPSFGQVFQICCNRRFHGHRVVSWSNHYRGRAFVLLLAFLLQAHACELVYACKRLKGEQEPVPEVVVLRETYIKILKIRGSRFGDHFLVPFWIPF